MALYSFANGHSINASKLLCRARYIILTCCGENHPQISLIDVRRIFIDVREDVKFVYYRVILV
jgi:hypothetical protein